MTTTIGKTHKAYRLHAYGGPENLRLDDVPIPTPGKAQVLVAVSAVGMNPFDWKVRDGMVKDFVPFELPKVLGVDFVGAVAALGEGSSRFKIGDRVMTLSTSLGAFAEHIAVDEAVLARVPESLSDLAVRYSDRTESTEQQRLRDREQEEAWCSDHRSIRQKLVEHGFAPEFELEIPAGVEPVKVVRSREPRSQEQRRNRARTKGM